MGVAHPWSAMQAFCTTRPPCILATAGWLNLQHREIRSYRESDAQNTPLPVFSQKKSHTRICHLQKKSPTTVLLCYLGVLPSLSEKFASCLLNG